MNNMKSEQYTVFNSSPTVSVLHRSIKLIFILLTAPSRCHILAFAPTSLRRWSAPSHRRTTTPPLRSGLEIWIDDDEICTGTANSETQRLAADAILVRNLDHVEFVRSEYVGRTTRLFHPGDDGRLRDVSSTNEGTVVGVVVDASTPEGVDRAIAAMGSTTWVLALSNNENNLDGTDWNMIPAENMVGSAKGTGTKVAFCVREAGDAAGLANALELGVDALCVPLHDEIMEAALQLKLEREISDSKKNKKDHEPSSVPVLCTGRCRRGGALSAVRADRVCVDLVRTLLPTEGCWLGSSAMLTALVLSEAASSSLVPSRPFRINAGPVHSYIVVTDGKTEATKYLSELEAGRDEVLVYDAATGNSRAVAVGRLKTEVRPCVRVDLGVQEEILSGQVFLQQAETVRLGQQGGSHVRVTDLSVPGSGDEDDEVLLRIVGTGTHIGKAYGGKVSER